MEIEINSIRDLQTQEAFEAQIKLKSSAKNGKFFLFNINKRYKDFYERVVEQKNYGLIRTEFKGNTPVIEQDKSVISRDDSIDVFLDDIEVPGITYNSGVESRLATVK
mgnify:CR=1 FL=1